MRHRNLSFCCLVAIAAVACATLKPSAGGGTSRPLTFSILEDYDKGTDLQLVDRDFSLFNELGVQTWRGSFGWDDYEPEPGRYDFAWLHEFITLAAERRITLRPYVAYTPEWAAAPTPDADGQPWNQPPRDQRQWSAFIAALARELRHHPNVASLEVYNEQNVTQWWEGSRELYAETLRNASAAVRGRGPLELLAGGLVYPDLEWVEDVCAAAATGAAFDVLPVHAYPETWTPPEVTVENYLGAGFGDRFAAAVDRACGPKRIWINETGFATVPGRTERDQAAWWVRAIATFAAEPRVEHVGIYEIRDLAADKPAIGDAPNYHLGLVHTDGTPKLAFSTIDRLVDLFGGGTIAPVDGELLISRAAPAGELHHHAFARADGNRVVVVWNRTADETIVLRGSSSYGTAVEYGIDGREIGTYELGELHLRAGIPRVLRFGVR